MLGLSLLFTVVLAVVLAAATGVMFFIGKKREWLTQLTLCAAAAIDLVIVFAFVAFLA